MNLTNKQKQHLKSLAHSLKPVVMLGNNGLTEAIIAEIDQALTYHELIKVKIISEDRQMLKLITDAITRETQACNVQVIGKILTIYRPSEAHKIKLPR